MNRAQELREHVTKHVCRLALGLEKDSLFTKDLLAFFSDQELKHLENLINNERVQRKLDAELHEFEMREHEHALRNSNGRMI